MSELILDLPNKKYNTIVIDPPWKISMSGKIKHRPNKKTKLDYETMTLEEIKSIPIYKIANTGCHVYCWTTNKMLKETFEVLESWNVNYHLTLVWTKPTGMMPCFGYKFATEFCLLGFFGKPMQKFTNMGKLNWIKKMPQKPHSTKPQEFYDLIRKMSPKNYFEMFARKQRSDWDVWGNEIE